MTGVRRSFLPWYRTGYAAALTGPPPAGSGRAPVPAGVRLRDDGGRGRVAVPMVLAGPGDVVGIDPREVGRLEPYDGCPDAEPSYFPYVEFASPDLPWRFTPDGVRSAPLPGGQATREWVRPWLALVVVPAERATLTVAESGGTPVLRCPGAELPDPGEVWAWAHVQVTHDVGDPVTAGAAVARLICPRRLAGGVRYLACVVPAYAAGRDAVVPGPDADPLAPAWGGDGDVSLPAYVQWTFTTGPGGSFESLVRRLRPRRLPSTSGSRPLAVGAPGWGARAGSADAEAGMQGALRPVGVNEPPMADDVLAESLRTAVSRSGPGVELRPPLYGQDYQHGRSALAPSGQGWLDTLNTDPRRRVAAGLAAWAVAVNQEELVDTAWSQLATSRPRPTSPPPDRITDSPTGHITGSMSSRMSGPAAPTAGPDPALAAAVAGSLADRHGIPVTTTPPASEGFAPYYPGPAYALLRGIAPEWILPAVGDLPLDTVALAETNQAFVESFLVGLNHALARELQWRRYPVRADGTFFDVFWGGASAHRLPALAGWNADDALGSHSGPGDQIVLVLRGALLRRFPTATIYLSRTAASTEELLLPAFSGRIGPDTTFLGFPLTTAAATEPPPAGTTPWTVIIQESVSHTRFGLDDPPTEPVDQPIPAPADPPADPVNPPVPNPADDQVSAEPPQSWQDLDWSHPHLADRTHVPMAGPLAGVTLPAARGSAATATWALDAAQTAVAVQQPAFRVRIPLALWLTPPPEPEQPS
ncbi:hypothetical protein Aph01nite_48880 [Acrocarpospora phusangensis]|uniref:Uncharacterized protein n=1 Tax=Acrocarpospora phusangensis TaxID=1070424 RepID=A0A919QFH8_9ACTN|nr:hypothetical protein [Acrocarpospora phusangensis]GIH26578.1 hypothetical protein Aph01nite_48880 [Acrocarpospora phusangensis]